jgi:hypothetical protein
MFFLANGRVLPCRFRKLAGNRIAVLSRCESIVCARAVAECCWRAASAPLNFMEIMPAAAIPPESFA